MYVYIVEIRLETSTYDTCKGMTRVRVAYESRTLPFLFGKRHTHEPVSYARVVSKCEYFRCFELNTSTSNYGEMRNSEGIIRHTRRYSRPQLEKNSELSDSDGGNTVSFVQPIRAFKSRRVTRKPELSFITPFQSGFCNLQWLQRPQQPATDRNPKRKKKNRKKRKKRKSWSEINSFERQTLITCLLFIAEEYGYGN